MARMADPAQATEAVGIVLADDHAMVRSGLRRVLDSEPGLSVVAEAGDVEEALVQTRAHQPRLVLIDLHMPGRSTLSAIPELLEAAPGCAVLVLTMESEPALARSALNAGAAGYVLKEAAEEELVEAVRALLAGRTYLDPSLGARLATGDTLAPGPAPGLELSPGATFAGHRIGSVLGRGGMGVVYEATDLFLDRTVALKLITPEIAGDRAFRSRFERECRLAAAIDHPHVVEIYHAGEEAGLAYLTMRYVDGPDLRRQLRRDGQMDPRPAVRLIVQIAGALEEAHRLGLVHRDVKPANILIEARPGGEHAFLTDFGLTKPTIEESVTRTARPLGSVDYIAPEQAEGATVDGRADVYSLGCVLFQMLTGSVVFPQETDLAKLWAHVHAPAPELRSLRPDLPASLEEVLGRALAKDPEQRQQSAGEFADGVRMAVSPVR
jgi:DNA-binding NarL/FixJ family response regulator